MKIIVDKNFSEKCLKGKKSVSIFQKDVEDTEKGEDSLVLVLGDYDKLYSIFDHLEADTLEIDNLEYLSYMSVDIYSKLIELTVHAPIACRYIQRFKNLESLTADMIYEIDSNNLNLHKLNVKECFRIIGCNKNNIAINIDKCHINPYLNNCKVNEEVPSDTYDVQNELQLIEEKCGKRFETVPELINFFATHGININQVIDSSELLSYDTFEQKSELNKLLAEHGVDTPVTDIRRFIRILHDLGCAPIHSILDNFSMPTDQLKAMYFAVFGIDVTKINVRTYVYTTAKTKYALDSILGSSTSGMDLKAFNFCRDQLLNLCSYIGMSQAQQNMLLGETETEFESKSILPILVLLVKNEMLEIKKLEV